MATLQDIAVRLHVSVSTVSRALAGHPHVREELRAQVQQVARELGYRPNALAQGLRRSQSKTVGLIVPDIQNHSYSAVTAAFQAALQRFGYGLVLYVSNNDVEVERRCLERLMEQRVDGLAYVPCTRSLPQPQALETDVPVVEIFRSSGSSGADTVTYDDDLGAKAAIGHLLDQGHRSIGVMVGPRGYSSTRRRLRGVHAAFSERALSPKTVRVVHSDYTPDGAHEAFTRLFLQGERPSAVFAASAQLVLGLLVVCKHLKVSIPDDISLIGLGDPVWYEIAEPSISAYAAPVAEIGMTAVQLLVSRLEGRPSDERRYPTNVVVSGRLVLRQSTAPYRASS